jgi:hypothetical protein
MEEIFYCDCCNSPVRLIEKLKNTKPNQYFPKGNRVRRYYCDICDLQKTVFANGYKQEKIEPYLANQELKDIYKEQEEINNQRN